MAKHDLLGIHHVTAITDDALNVTINFYRSTRYETS